MRFGDSQSLRHLVHAHKNLFFAHLDSSCFLDAAGFPPEAFCWFTSVGLASTRLPVVGRHSFFNLRLTYGASHPIACDGCDLARAVAGGESLFPVLVDSSGDRPDSSGFGFARSLRKSWRPLPDLALTEKSLSGGSSFNFQGPVALSIFAYDHYTIQFCLSQEVRRDILNFFVSFSLDYLKHICYTQ